MGNGTHSVVVGGCGLTVIVFLQISAPTRWFTINFLCTIGQLNGLKHRYWTHSGKLTRMILSLIIVVVVVCPVPD